MWPFGRPLGRPFALLGPTGRPFDSVPMTKGYMEGPVGRAVGTHFVGWCDSVIERKGNARDYLTKLR